MFISCNDWLDVNPRSQVKSKVLYETQDGFKMALNGVYIKLASADLYGQKTSMYIPDALARMWSYPTDKTSLLRGLSTHDYTISNVENEFSAMFSNYYNAIAQLNDLLYNLETSSITFEYNNDKLLKAEAMGLRAYLHFDVLRYFGPIPSDAKDGDVTIPYVTELTTATDKLTSKSWKDVITSIENDLTSAETLLKQYDPIVNLKIEDLKNTYNMGKPNMPVDNWQYYRQARFNYYAVLGAKARFYHWIGDKVNAVKYAKMVIDANKFQLCNESSFSGANASLTMYQEHLLGLNNPDIDNITQSLFKETQSVLTQTPANVKTAYEATIHVNDIRNIPNRYWQEKTYQNSEKMNHFYKYTGNGVIESDERIPLLRYVEMYFILIEDLPLSEAKSYFVTYRQSRVLSSTIDDVSVTDENAVLQRLEKEYRKEFYGEGQLFFFYKKHKYTQFTWPNNYVIKPTSYVIPKPKGIIDFE